MSKKEQLTYERAHAELGKILQTLQRHDISLEEMTTHLHRAKELIEFCREQLYLTESELEDIFAEDEEE